MSKLYLAVEITDFDVDRVGFSLSVIDVPMKRQASQAYLRMTLPELDIFLGALKAAQSEIRMATLDPSGISRPPAIKAQPTRNPHTRQAAAA
jgi:hypothetical protein